MLFAIHAIDAPEAPAIREKIYAQHAAHLKAQGDFGVTLVMGGPLIKDDGNGSVGSLMLVEAPDRATVETFNSADPFAKNGVWAKVQITRFEKRTG